MKKTTLSTFILALAFSPLGWTHHYAPDEMQDFIEDQLMLVDSPHLLSSEDDPSLLDETVASVDDLDYVVVSTEMEATDVVVAIDDILLELDRQNEVCDYSSTIDFDEDDTYTLTLYVDFCDF
jgi:hypothetical protein